jgi:ribosome maturation factor RimP
MESTTAQIWSLVEPVAAELGLEVLEIELGGGTSNRLLRIYLDSRDANGAVSISDCAKVSRRVGDVLDAHDTVAEHYMLEVSSPGVNRPLRKREHFERVVGGRIRVKLASPGGKKRSLLGRLAAMDGDVAKIETEEGNTERFALEEVQQANFEFEFEQPAKPGNAKPGKRKRRR